MWLHFQAWDFRVRPHSLLTLFEKNLFDPVRQSWHLSQPQHNPAFLSAALKVSSARLHVAGTPCTDYSLKGGQLREAGLTFILFLAWCAQRLLLQEDILIQENVPQFPVALLVKFLGSLYYVETAILAPFDLGWGVQRKRRWTVLRHRYKTKAFTSPLNAFSAMFNCPTWFGMWRNFCDRCPAWDIFFCGTKAEIVNELMSAASRPGSQWHLTSLLSQEALMKEDLTPNMFFSALTSCEQEHLFNYISACVQDQMQVFSLNQNPEHVDTRSNWERLQTLIKNAGVMWHLGCASDHWLRWIHTIKVTW